MKYLVLLADGMADLPLVSLDNLSVMEVADKPYIDGLMPNSIAGFVQTIPSGLLPGSDVANLAILGYDPRMFYSGRAPFEAISMGVDLRSDEVAFRANFITLSSTDNIFSEKVMVDFTAGDIATNEATILLDYLRTELALSKYKFYIGNGYRNIMICQHDKINFNLTPPHDILDKKISDYLPKNQDSQFLLELMSESYNILSSHPINQKRVNEGKLAANAIWFWGEGSKPQLMPFAQKTGLKSAVISGVDMINGLGLIIGMDLIRIEGVTGNFYTNYQGKAQAAIQALREGYDFVYLHVEAPDECGHQGKIKKKIQAIEQIDKMVETILAADLDLKLMILPDHATPVELRTHISDPVPFLVYQKGVDYQSSITKFSERMKSSLFVERGFDLMDKFINNTFGE